MKIKEPRKYIPRSMLDELELEAHLTRSVERYAYIRQWLSGRVLDCGCGMGYGTYMISQNPDVEFIRGFDNDLGAIEIARKEYPSIDFFCGSLEEYDICDFYDWMVIVEVIEHLEHPEELAKLAQRVIAKKIILTYPSKKTSHYNPFHKHDFKVNDIRRLFPNFSIEKSYDFHATHDTQIVFLERVR